MTDTDRRMLTQHLVELEVKRLFDEGKISGTVHLSLGQEAVDQNIIGAFDNPLVFGNHRSHGQYLAATNGDINGLFQQIKDGYSQHLYSRDRFMSNGVQGSLVPVAFGAALSFAMRGIDRPVLCFIGDGTLGQGVVYETLGLMQRYEVNLKIVVIDNRYSMSETEESADLQRIGQAFAIPTTQWPRHYDDFCEYGPRITYALTERLCGHSANDTEMYRPAYERTHTYCADHSPVLRRSWLSVWANVQSYVRQVSKEVFG